MWVENQRKLALLCIFFFVYLASKRSAKTRVKNTETCALTVQYHCTRPGPGASDFRLNPVHLFGSGENTLSAKRCPPPLPVCAPRRGDYKIVPRATRLERWSMRNIGVDGIWKREPVTFDRIGNRGETRKKYEKKTLWKTIKRNRNPIDVVAWIVIFFRESCWFRFTSPKPYTSIRWPYGEKCILFSGDYWWLCENLPFRIPNVRGIFIGSIDQWYRHSFFVDEPIAQNKKKIGSINQLRSYLYACWFSRTHCSGVNRKK